MLNRSYTTGKYYRDGAEITQAEYEVAMTENREKAGYVNDLLRERIKLADVPTAWWDEIARRVETYKQAAQEDEELSAEEALDVLFGGAVSLTRSKAEKLAAILKNVQGWSL